MNFIDGRSLFEDVFYTKDISYMNRYNRTKQFYDENVYGQYSGPNYVFAKDCLKVIKDLELDKKMEQKRKEIKSA